MCVSCAERSTSTELQCVCLKMLLQPQPQLPVLRLPVRAGGLWRYLTLPTLSLSHPRSSVETPLQGFTVFIIGRLSQSKVSLRHPIPRSICTLSVLCAGSTNTDHRGHGREGGE